MKLCDKCKNEVPKDGLAHWAQVANENYDFCNICMNFLHRQVSQWLKEGQEA